jgi:hypothetical protein
MFWIRLSSTWLDRYKMTKHTSTSFITLPTLVWKSNEVESICFLMKYGYNMWRDTKECRNLTGRKWKVTNEKPWKNRTRMWVVEHFRMVWQPLFIRCYRYLCELWTIFLKMLQFWKTKSYYRHIGLVKIYEKEK